MLLLEHNCDDLKNYDIQWVLTRKEARPRYTQVDSNSEKNLGYNTKGIIRYNEFVMIVQTNQNTNESKEIKMQLKSQYVRICGKTERRGRNTDSAENVADDSGQSLEPYDGFTSDVNMSPVSNGIAS